MFLPLWNLMLRCWFVFMIKDFRRSCVQCFLLAFLHFSSFFELGKPLFHNCYASVQNWCFRRNARTALIYIHMKPPPAVTPPPWSPLSISELNGVNPFFLYNCTWPSFSSPIQVPAPLATHHCSCTRCTSVIVDGHRLTFERWCQVHCNYCGHCCYNGAATSNNTQTLVFADCWLPPSHLTWCLFSRNRPWLPPPLNNSMSFSPPPPPRLPPPSSSCSKRS